MASELIDLALRFAQAIVRPGRNAGLIAADNRLTQWVPVEEAVASGLAYLVEPRDGILPLDLDTAEDESWSERVRQGLEPQGCRFVRTASGRPGHGHMWIIAPPGWSNFHLKNRAHEAGGSHSRATARRDSGTRPPYSPHRELRGVRSEVVLPDPVTALAWFEETLPRPLPDLARARLVGLDPSVMLQNRGTPSRGITLHAVACSAVNARWSFDDFLRVLREPQNQTASKYRELPPGAREDYASKLWSEAMEFVRDNPPNSPAHVAREALQRLAEALPEVDWTSRTGANDRAAYAALLHIADRAATLQPSASIRQLAEEANLSNDGISAALRRLMERRLVERIPAESYGLACRYRLLTGWLAASKVCVAPDNTDLSMGAQRLVLSGPSPLLDDIFSNGSGLGISRRETWEALPQTPTKVADLARLHRGRLTVPTLRSHLRDLEMHGLVARQGHRWWRCEVTEGDLTRVAELLGVKGKGLARREYNRRQQQEYRARFSIQLDARPEPAPARRAS